MNSGWRGWFVGGGLLLALATYVGASAAGMSHAAAITAAVTVLCAAWWCTEAVPIPVTSLVPFAVFPLAGVLNDKELAAALGDKFVLLFMTGFMLARAAEKSRTHLRVAHGIVRFVGTKSSKRLVVGFMLATAFCSMWLSNTAVALIMLPVALAVIEEADDAKLAPRLLLAIAYGSSIGGIATIIGTPPNGVFVAVYEETMKATEKSVDFLSWMKIGVPVAVLMFIATAVVLTLPLRGALNYRLAELGSWTPGQKRVLAVLAGTAALWVTRSAPYGGWSDWLNMPNAQDATVGFVAVVLMFLIPNGERDDNGRRQMLLDWETARSIPWGILILFAGGIAIAKAFKASGLDAEIGTAMQAAFDLPPIVLIALLCLSVTFLTEVTSNTATTTLLMPILAAAGVAAGFDPAFIMIPAAMSASCAFMLPVATPPNAIIFGSDHITIPQMARTGVIINLIGVVIITAVCYLMLGRTTGL